ncbi:nuclear transport factor 2 family protein [Phenylobacterium sp.]|uniref:nuclear transport factor 2 family protein n=1 Tax=Phenylobacterium sp. TaxID=1871053 RepID=UPI00286CECD8|nr:nuclear transport factor 2 family protein [Phenylobacterium sp.]
MALTVPFPSGVLAALVLIAPTTATALPDRQTGPAIAEASAPLEAVSVVDAFHGALASGDTAQAAKLVSDAVLVFEAGGAERSRAEYASSHLAADASFAQAVPAELTRRTGGASADIAWVASEGRTRGRFRDRDVDRVTTETAILQKLDGVWRIVHVHWSSRAPAAAH